MTQPRDIESRIHNWARWCQVHRQPAISITGLICDRMRRSVLGNVWSGHDLRDPVDDADAQHIERGMRRLLPMHFLMLKMHYVQRLPKHIVCRRLRIRVMPEAYFDQALHAAQAAIENIANKEKK